VFITTPSLTLLEERLNARNTDSIEIIEKRINNAKIEVGFFQDYDYLIINDDLEIAAKELVCIANIARIKTKLFDKEKIVSNWLN
jgi:guanylate kinase